MNSQPGLPDDPGLESGDLGPKYRGLIRKLKVGEVLILDGCTISLRRPDRAELYIYGETVVSSAIQNGKPLDSFMRPSLKDEIVRVLQLVEANCPDAAALLLKLKELSNDRKRVD